MRSSTSKWFQDMLAEEHHLRWQLPAATLQWLLLVIGTRGTALEVPLFLNLPFVFYDRHVPSLTGSKSEASY